MIKLDEVQYNTCVAVSGEGDCVWTTGGSGSVTGSGHGGVSNSSTNPTSESNSGGFFGTPPPTPGTETTPELTNTVTLLYNPSLYSVPTPINANTTTTTANNNTNNNNTNNNINNITNNNINNMNLPKISLQLWSSVFGGLFDNTVAICLINIVPILGHPNRTVER